MKKLYLALAVAGIICCSFINSHIKPVQRMLVKLSADTIILPETYTSRKFMPNNTGSDYDAASIPGNIVKYDSASATYEVETMTAIIKGNKPATAQKLNNGAIFSGTIPSDSKFNGSPAIDGVKAGKGQVIDLEVKDDMTYAVPDGQIDTATIRATIKDIPANTRKSMFYIASATVSIINYKIHDAETTVGKLNNKMDKLNKPDTAKKGISIKAKSQSKPPPFSSSSSKVLNDKVISVQLIPVDQFAAVAVKK